MPFSPDEAGQRRPLSFRVGREGFRFRGVHREPNRQDLTPPDTFWYLQNCRVDNGLVTGRGGQARVNSSALAGGCIIGLHDDLLDSAEALVWNGSVWVYNPAFQAAPYQTVTSPADAGGLLVYYTPDWILVGGDGIHLFDWELSSTPPQGRVTLLASLSAGQVVTSRAVWSGKLWLGVRDGTSAKVYSWDGTALALDATIAAGWDAQGNAPVVGVAADDSDLYVATTSAIRKRAGGSWTSLTMPGAIVDPWHPNGPAAVYGSGVVWTGREKEAFGSGNLAVALSVAGTAVTLLDRLSAAVDSFAAKVGPPFLHSATGKLIWAYTAGDAGDNDQMLRSWNGSVAANEDNLSDDPIIALAKDKRVGWGEAPFSGGESSSPDLYGICGGKLFRSVGGSLSTWSLVATAGFDTDLQVDVVAFRGVTGG